MVFRTGFIDQAQLREEVEKAARALGPEVVRLRYTVKADNSGDPAIYFRIVLADWATDEKSLAKVPRKIENTLINAIHPIENWGLFPYFSYRGNSEQFSEPEWF